MQLQLHDLDSDKTHQYEIEIADPSTKVISVWNSEFANYQQAITCVAHWNYTDSYTIGDSAKEINQWIYGWEKLLQTKEDADFVRCLRDILSIGFKIRTLTHKEVEYCTLDSGVMIIHGLTLSQIVNLTPKMQSVICPQLIFTSYNDMHNNIYQKQLNCVWVQIVNQNTTIPLGISGNIPIKEYNITLSPTSLMTQSELVEVCSICEQHYNMNVSLLPSSPGAGVPGFVIKDTNTSLSKFNNSVCRLSRIINDKISFREKKSMPYSTTEKYYKTSGNVTIG